MYNHDGWARGPNDIQELNAWRGCDHFKRDITYRVAFGSSEGLIEKIKTIANPLTLIAVFASLAEIAMTAGLAVVDESLHTALLCFVVGFPALLVVLFFLTLNFNHRVLYAPKDYKDESHFLQTITPLPKVDMSRGVSVDVRETESQMCTEMKTVEQIREVVNRLYRTDDAQIFATNIGYRQDDAAKSDWIENDWADFLYAREGESCHFNRILSVSSDDERKAVQAMAKRSRNPNYDLRIVEAPANPLPYPNLVIAARRDRVTAFVSFRGPSGRDPGAFAFYSEDQEFCRGLLAHIFFFHQSLPKAGRCIGEWKEDGRL